MIKSYPNVVVIATLPDSTDLPNKIHRLFDLVLTLPPLTVTSRTNLFKSFLEGIPHSIDFDQAGTLTTGMSITDIHLLLHTLLQTPPLTPETFQKGIETIHSLSKITKIPRVLWDDIGGLETIKQAIMETITLPMTNPELFARGVKKRTGILLYGPPGTGKTLVAKAVATSLNLNFISIKGPELLDMYIGESEVNVRRVFEEGRRSKPCILFFDEVDSLAPARGRANDGGGVMDRIVSQLVTELDNIPEGVYCIAATNRPDLLDPGLLRPGRFEKMLYLGVCEDHESQEKMLKALTRKFKLEDVDLGVVSRLCPLTFTGADLYALCTDANLKAIERVISRIDLEVVEWNKSGPHPGYPDPTTTAYYVENLCKAGDVEVRVREEDFKKAVEELTPSLSLDEIVKYEKLRERFSPDGGSAAKPNPFVDRKGKGKA